jgi:hypothetical protein
LHKNAFSQFLVVNWRGFPRNPFWLNNLRGDGKTRRLYDKPVSAHASPGGCFLRNPLRPSWMGAKTVPEKSGKKHVTYNNMTFGGGVKTRLFARRRRLFFSRGAPGWIHA